MPLRMRTSRVHPTSVSPPRYLHQYERARETVAGTSRARISVPLIDDDDWPFHSEDVNSHIESYVRRPEADSYQRSRANVAFIDDDEDGDSELESYVRRPEADSRHRSRFNPPITEEASSEVNEDTDSELGSYARRLEAAGRQRSRANVAYIDDDDDEDGESEMESYVRKAEADSYQRSRANVAYIEDYEDGELELESYVRQPHKTGSHRSRVNIAFVEDSATDREDDVRTSSNTPRLDLNALRDIPVSRATHSEYEGIFDRGVRNHGPIYRQNKNQSYTHHTISKDRAADEKTEYDDLLLAELGKKHAHRLVLSDDKLLATRGRNISLRNNSDLVED